MKKDFIGIFKSLAGRPATIRLLDPPLHEFIGTMDAAQKKDLSKKIGMSAPAITKGFTLFTRKTQCLVTADAV